MIIAYCIFIPILLFISGFAKAIMDLSEEGKKADKKATKEKKKK